MRRAWMAAFVIAGFASSACAKKDAAPPHAKAGDVVTFDDDSQWSVASSKDLGADLPASNGAPSRHSNGHFVRVTLTVTNLDPHPAHVLVPPRVVDAKGRVAGKIEDDAAYLDPGETPLGSAPIAPSAGKTFSFVVDAADKDAALSVEVAPLALGRKERRAIDL